MRLFSLIYFLISVCQLIGQNYEATIIRDEWGVPHIHGKTDADAAYGLNWAHCEDDFENVQKALLASKFRLAEVDGVEGAILCVGAFLMNAQPMVDQYYESDLSPEFRRILDASAAAYNQYAETFPNEVLRKNLFPVNGKDIINAYILGQGIVSNAFFDIARVFTGKIKPVPDGPFTAGSNAFAYAPHKTKENQTVLISNTHQPLDGIMSWYEAHVMSDEGMNIVGATFSIGATIFLGANENLAWTHTTNYPDFSDVFQLEMHPTKKNMYKYDDEWLELEERVLKMKVKVGPIKIPYKKKFYWSKYGTTLKKDGQYYSVRFPARDGIKAAEQWWHMCKAKDYKEFKKAVNMQGLTSQNLMYGDKEGNIYYLSNGYFPYRDESKNWREIQIGNTSKINWDYRKYHPISALPQLENPECGYLFNSNNPPFLATAEGENLNREDYPKSFGFRKEKTNRALRVNELLNAKQGKISYDEIKEIKYDLTYFSESFYTWGIENLDSIMNLDAKKYPDLSDAIHLLATWDRNTHHTNTKAAFPAVFVFYLLKYHADEILVDQVASIPEDVCVEAMRKAKKFMNRKYGTIELPLGTLQRHIKGDISLPVSGMPEIVAPVFLEKYDKKTFRNMMGDSYILFACYDEEGNVKVETCHPFGASNKKDSKHYTDQMELYTNQKLKTMSLDMDEVKVESRYVVRSKN